MTSETKKISNKLFIVLGVLLLISILTAKPKGSDEVSAYIHATVLKSYLDYRKFENEDKFYNYSPGTLLVQARLENRYYLMVNKAKQDISFKFKGDKLSTKELEEHINSVLAEYEEEYQLYLKSNSEALSVKANKINNIER